MTAGSHGSPTVLPLLKKISIENNKTKQDAGPAPRRWRDRRDAGHQPARGNPHQSRHRAAVSRITSRATSISTSARGIYPIMHTGRDQEERLRALSVRRDEPLRRLREIEEDRAGKALQPARGALHDAVPDARDRRHLGGVQRRSVALRTSSRTGRRWRRWCNISRDLGLIAGPVKVDDLFVPTYG